MDMESGASSTRKEFGKMFVDAAKRKFDMVLFWSLDRFSREGCRRTIQYLQQLNDNKVIYKSYTEQYLDSSGIFRDVIISFLSVLAQQERIRLSERVRAGLDKAKSQGRIGGRPRIHGKRLRGLMS
jgi:DNA invertase Pin-like site-specific DNA recombinase